MIDSRVFFFKLDSPAVGNDRFMALTVFHDEGFIEQQGDGWVPVNHTLTPVDGGWMLSVLANREVESLGL